MMPPAHIPAASTCTTTARSSLGRTDGGAKTTSPITPPSAATTGMRRGGFAHWIFGLICPRRRAKERLVEGQPAVLVSRRDRRRVVAQPRLAAQRLRLPAVDEGHVLENELPHGELVAAPDDDAVARRVHAQHVPRARLRQAPEASPLPDGVERRAAVGAELAPARVDDGADRDGHARLQVLRRLAARDEADLLAFRLVGHG